MDRLNGELTKLAAANKKFEKSHKDLQTAQKVLEKRASNTESAHKQAQAKLKSAEEAAASGQKLLEAVSASLGQLAAPGIAVPAIRACPNSQPIELHSRQPFSLQP